MSVRGKTPTGKRSGGAAPEMLLQRARALARRTARDDAALVAAIQHTSRTYTQARDELLGLAGSDARHASGLGFFLPRDLPKAAAVLRELAQRGRLPRRTRLRVLDLGAGFGTTTFSLALVAREAGICDALDVVAVDLDGRALEGFADLASVEDPALVPVTLTRRVGDLATAAAEPSPVDVVLVGLALNELGADDAARAELVARLLARLTEGGVLIVLEPALAEPAARLVRLRDAMVGAGASVLYPCTHTAACPLRDHPRDWCHAELDEPLPAPEAALARAAGLRDERPTFAALALSRRPAALDVAEPGQASQAREAGADDEGVLVRVISRPLGSKGKTELHLCGARGLVRARALDRDPPDPPLDHYVRGDLARLDAPAAEAVRVPRDGTLRPA